MKRRIIIIAAIILAALVIAIALTPDRWDKLLALARWAESAPGLAWPLFLVGFAFAVVAMFPGWIFMVIGGYLFGMTIGTLLSFIANLAGSLVAFYLARFFARHHVEARFSRKTWFRNFDASVQRNGFHANLFARLALLPYNLLNYACGLTSMSLRDFLFGTALGSLPILLANVLIGAGTVDLFATMAQEGLEPQRPPLEILAALIAIFAIALILARRFRRRLPAQIPPKASESEDLRPEP